MEKVKKNSDTECLNEDSKEREKEARKTKKDGKEKAVGDDDDDDKEKLKNNLKIKFEINLCTVILFLVSFLTRFYNLTQPNSIVFDELHYGKYVSLYIKRTFFFDQHPPFGKQLVAGVAYLAGYSGNYTFGRIGSEYTNKVPIFWLRFIPALCGCLLAPLTYKLLVQLKLNRWTAFLGGFLIIFDNALITQSRFILMEPILLLFSLLGLLFLIKFEDTSSKLYKQNRNTSFLSKFRVVTTMIFYGMISAFFLAIAISIKYVGIYTYYLGLWIGVQFLWKMVKNRAISDTMIFVHMTLQSLMFVVIPVAVYTSIFWVHLNILYKAGPHDSVMTSAFQASLKGGLASITNGQPLNVAHGSQITLRHTLGRTCWLHSHAHVYPVRYPDSRGSSHQQQVTCYSFKDVNNWWIVKRPNKTNLVVRDATDTDEPDIIKHGDIIQLIHGITGRALNSHDVAAAMSPQSQEVSCYIDYNVSMPAQNLWKVSIINREGDDDNWHAIKSQIRLIHVITGAALRFSSRQLPDWGFNQYEVVADRNIEQTGTIWNVEEHRYTIADNQQEREKQLLQAEMIPTSPTKLSFFKKFFELQQKMLSFNQHGDTIQTHMYSSEPLDWPFLSKTIAYWVDKNSNAQIHLIGNIVIWYSGTLAILIYVSFFVLYLLRRRRQLFDISEKKWKQFCACGNIFFVGYLIHFVPYFFVEKTMFLHNYLPALIFKMLLLCFVIEHIYYILKFILRSRILVILYQCILIIWFIAVLYIFKAFSAISYGHYLSEADIINLRWKDTWDFILHKVLS